MKNTEKQYMVYNWQLGFLNDLLMGMMARVFNLSAQEAEAEECLFTRGRPSLQPGLQAS